MHRKERDLFFFKKSSTNCTNTAIIRIKDIVCKNSSPKITNNSFKNHVMAPDIVITKITASPIPIAESLLFDIPKKRTFS